LNTDIDQLGRHLQEIPESDIKLKDRLKMDFVIRNENKAGKTVVKCSLLLQRVISTVVNLCDEESKKILLSIIGLFLATENIELSSQLYAEYTGRFHVFSDQKLELIENIISQESSKIEDLNKESFFDDLTEKRKCNHALCCFEFPRTREDRGIKSISEYSALTISGLAIIMISFILFLICMFVLYPFSYAISFVTSLPSLYCTILFYFTIVFAIVFSWYFRERLHDFVVAIVLLTMENMFGLDKRHFNCHPLYVEKGSIEMPWLKSSIIFSCLVFFIWITFTTFDIRNIQQT